MVFIYGLSRFSSLMNTFYRRYFGDESYDWYFELVKNMWNIVVKVKILYFGLVIG